MCGEAVRVSGRGLHASENVGISNEKTGENPVRRKPKVSYGSFVLLSLVGPKARPQGVVDGCQVEIPEPGAFVEYAGTLLWGRHWCWLSTTGACSR